MKYLGVDWGTKKIGLAYSEGKLASPLTNLVIKNFDDGIKQLEEFIKKEHINRVVIGLPEGEMGRRVGKVIETLKKHGIMAEATDETLSTQEAKQFSLKTGISKRARRQDDALSAAIILQRYLDEK